MLNDIVVYVTNGAFPIQFIVTKFIGLILLWIEFDSFDEKYYLVHSVKVKTKISTRFRSLKKLVFGLKDLKIEINN